MKYDLEEAKKLREQGRTYKEIASIIGCSEIWCKRNLSSVVKNKELTLVINKFINTARSSTALTRSEVYAYVKDAYKPSSEELSNKQKKEEISKQVESMVNKITAKKDTIIRPSWMHPERAVSCYHKIASVIEELDSCVLELMDDFFDSTGVDRSTETERSLLRSIAYISKFGIALGVNSVNLLDSYDSVSNKLAERNGDHGFSGYNVKIKEAIFREDEIPY